MNQTTNSMLPKRFLTEKTFQGYFFEDFEINQQLIHGTPRTITSGDISLYIALTGSQHLLNCAETVAQACGFKRLPIDNLLLFHIAFGKTVPDISLNAVANLGYANCRFLSPVFAGDTISVTSKVIGLKENSNGKTGIVYVHSTAKNQHDTTVVEWKRWVMVHKKTPSTPMGIDHIPDLESSVTINQNLIPDDLNFDNFSSDWTACKHRLTHYQVGEIINHRQGMTINDSDHSLATRLYQNNARVHFDQHMMSQSAAGKRLVYGGHIMSLCRAITHSGLANGLWLTAINGGAHLNPSFAGDTVYAASIILDKGHFDNREDIGWLRLKTYGFKNIDEETINELMMEPEQLRISKQCVLELDYTLLMPN